MSKPTVGELERRGEKGERLRLAASDYKKYDFQRIAKACAEGDGMLTIYNAGSLSEWDRKDIAKYGGVMFEP